MHTQKIYVVDDSDDYRFVIQQIFNKFLPQYEVLFYTGGENMLKSLFKQSEEQSGSLPSLILMDLNMRGLSGIQTLKLMKNPADPVFNYIRRIPVIIMSNEEMYENVTECYRAGANAYLKKPIEFEKLKEQLKSVCYFWLHVSKVPELKN